MELRLDPEDLIDSNCLINKITFEKLTPSAQAVVILVGRGTFSRGGKKTRVIFPPKKYKR